MKKPFTVFAALFLISCSLFAQKNVIPVKAVANAFAKDFPGIKAKWEKEGPNYEVNFKQNSKSMSAVYDPSGNRMETEEDIAVTSLPQAAKDYIASHYKGSKIKDAAMITKANGEVNYEAEVNKIDVIFSKDGAFLRTAKD